MATMLSAVKEILKYNINHMWVQKKKSKRPSGKFVFLLLFQYFHLSKHYALQFSIQI